MEFLTALLVAATFAALGFFIGRKSTEKVINQLGAENANLLAQYNRVTDRGPDGRFIKAEAD